MRYEQAADELAAGNKERAAKLFQEAAEAGPDEPWAADALFSAATLYEERLAKPAKANALYLRLLRRYPEARTARAAKRRQEALDSNLGSAPDRAALTRWTEILRDYPSAGPERSVAAAQALLRDHPDYSGAHRVHLWLASKYRELGQLEGAAQALERAGESAKDDSERFAARSRRIALDISRGQLGAAERDLDSIETAGDAGRRRVVADLRGELSRARLRGTAYAIAITLVMASLIGLLLFLVNEPTPTSKLLWPWPRQVPFVLPIFALLLAMSLTGHSDLGPAVAIIAGLGVTLIWLSGACLRATRSPRMIAALVLVTALGGLSAVYIAVHQGALIDQIIETVRFGPDV